MQICYFHVSVAVEAIDLDPGVLGNLTYTVSNPLFAVQKDSNTRTARIVVNGWAVLIFVALWYSELASGLIYAWALPAHPYNE